MKHPILAYLYIAGLAVFGYLIFNQSAQGTVPRPKWPRTVNVIFAWNESPTAGVDTYHFRMKSSINPIDDQELFLPPESAAVIPITFYHPGEIFTCTIAAQAVIDGVRYESVESNDSHWPRPAPVLVAYTVRSDGQLLESTDLQNWTPISDDASQGLQVPNDKPHEFFKGQNATIEPVFVQPD